MSQGMAVALWVHAQASMACSLLPIALSSPAPTWEDRSPRQSSLFVPSLHAFTAYRSWSGSSSVTKFGFNSARVAAVLVLETYPH